MSERLATVRQFGRGVFMWLRHGPRRVLDAVAEATNLPRGFWIVASLSGLLGAFTAIVTVAVAYRYHNHVPPAWVDSDGA